MQLTDKILSRKEFEDQPPVLLDIGASGSIHFRWKKIAKHCICIAFDPDEREYGYIVSEKKYYRKLYVFHCVVSDESHSAKPFYLTASPYCSSFLKPETDKLAPYAYAEKFRVEKQVSLPVKSLNEVLAELDLDYVDWFKTDSQGMDLRIFRSLGDQRINKVKIAEFEPGIIASYAGEDKLHKILAFMELKPFFLSHFEVKGAARISPGNLRALSGSAFMQKLLAVSHKKTAGWGELLFINTFETWENRTLRDYLLGSVLALLNEEYGFVLEIVQQAKHHYKDHDLDELQKYAGKKVKRAIWKFRFLEDVKKKIFG